MRISDWSSDVCSSDLANRYSKMEIAAFLIASGRFLTTEEVLSLTRSMASVGTRLDWAEELVVDKHCIGGIPGNRTSMVVVPIVAAHGLPMPKTRSEEHTYELQSLMRNSYAVLCMKKT